jgi:ribosomal protein S27E
MIQVKCPHCSRDIRAADEHAGKRIRCPGCKEVLPLPAAATAVQTAAPRPAPAAIQKAPPPTPKRKPAEEDDEDVPMLEAIEDDEDDDRKARKRKRAKEVEDEPEDDDAEYERRRRRRRNRSRTGDYANCPECHNRGDATRVGFTWWGGIVGPALLTHVRCNRCGTCYNGKSGKSNNTAIAIYVGVGLLLGVILGGCGLIAALLGNH